MAIVRALDLPPRPPSPPRPPDLQAFHSGTVSGIIPPKVKEIYGGLSTSEQQSVHRAYERLLWPDNVLAILKEMNEGLYEKLHAFREANSGRIDRLTPEARNFMEEVATNLMLLTGGEEIPSKQKIQHVARYLLDGWESLEQEDIESLKESFSTVAKAFAGQELRSIAGYTENKEGKQAHEPVARRV
ncbi:S1 protein [Aphelenchoides avenae]|nr:S1 protein [Aphelenchus avenae]